MEAEDIINGFREDISWHEKRLAENPTEEQRKRHELRIGHLQRKIVAMESILRRLEITNDMKMNLIAEDICERIMAVRKDNLADKFVGIIAYYELKPRWEWREDGLNPVACIGNVKDWPIDMCDMGDGTFCVNNPYVKAEGVGHHMWVLGGKYVPISCEKEVANA